MRVSLGGFELRDFEKPDLIQLGGKQSLAVREFPGENVSIQDMGATYRPITWTGIFMGPDAYERMMTIGLMRTAGKPVEFATEKFSMLVMIEEFLPDYKNDRRIPFAITLRKVIDNRPGSPQVDTVDKIAAQVEGGSPAAGLPAGNPQVYEVQAGDTLWQIAAKLKGDPNQWESIYLANQEVLVNGPNLIYPGMKLVIA